MQAELTDLQPVLAEAQIATDALMEEIEAKLPGVREQEEIVGAEAAVAQKEADTVQIEVDSVQADLDEALPALESAVQALNTIKDEDINAVRKLGKPPATVKLVAEGVCVMLSIKGVKIADPDDSSKKIMDYWGPSQKMMADKNFVQGLKDYDKDNINPKIMKTIRTTYMPNDKFNAESAAKLLLLPRVCVSGSWRWSATTGWPKSWGPRRSRWRRPRPLWLLPWANSTRRRHPSRSCRMTSRRCRLI
jgi:dynein heavy chain